MINQTIFLLLGHAGAGYIEFDTISDDYQMTIQTFCFTPYGFTMIQVNLDV